MGRVKRKKGPVGRRGRLNLRFVAACASGKSFEIRTLDRGK
jgi:hypothetical protein